MTYTEKIDVLELLISVIQEHEKKLDTLVTKIEKIAHSIEPLSGGELGSESISSGSNLIPAYLPNMEDY